MKLKTLHMFSDFYNSMQEIIEIQRSKSKLKFDLLEQKNKIPKIKQNNRINSGKKIEPTTKYLLTQLDENFLQNAIMANNTLKIRQIGVNSIHRKKTKPNDQIKINKNYNYDLSNIKGCNRIQSESDHNKNRQKLHVNQKKNSTQQIILQKEKKIMSVKSQINKSHVQVIQRNPSNNQLQIDDKFNKIDCNNIQKLYKNSNIVQKNNLVIINFWGLLASSNSHFFQLESNFLKQINLCLNFEKSIQQLNQNCNLVFILKKNNNNKQLQRILKQNQCDLIFLEIDQNKLFLDCCPILNEFEKQFQSVYYFSCLDTQFKMENKQLNLLNKNAFKGKIPKLSHHNFYILFFQNIVFQNQNIQNNQSVLIQILKFLQGQSNSIQKLDNLMQILKIQQDKIKKDDIQKKFEQKVLEIKKINKQNYQGSYQIRAGLQESIYNQFKADAQKRKIQVFFSYIGDLLLKNQSIDLSYHKNNKQLINQLSQINQQIFALSDLELEQNYLTLIINKIYFDIL